MDSSATLYEDLDELRQIEPAWRALAEDRGNPFLTPDWFFAWWDHYGAGLRPVIPALFGRDQQLNGLFPLTLPARSLGACRIAGANLGDHFHPLAVEGLEAEVAERAGELLRRSQGWTSIVLERIEPGRGWVEAFERGIEKRLTRTERPVTALPRIALADYGDWPEYLASRSSKLRKRLRWLERRLGDQGVTRRQTTNPAELSADLDAFFDLHDRRWSGRGGSSMASMSARSFHSQFAESALERGWLRLSFLEAGDEPIAAFYGWCLANRYVFYNAGFDPAWSRLSPGLALLAQVIEGAFAEGAREFDFLFGEEAYKSRFTDGERLVTDVALAPSMRPAAARIRAESALRSVGRALPSGFMQRAGVRRVARAVLPGRRR